MRHISEQIQHLKKQFSISWAVYEANWLLNSFAQGERILLNQEINLEDNKPFNEALSELNCVLFEKNEKREIISINQLKEQNHFWTIDCASYNSADSLIKEVKGSEASALSLLKTIFGDEQESKTGHIDNLLCSKNSASVVGKIINNLFQVNSIKLFPEQRRLDLRWVYTEKKIWEELLILDDEIRDRTKCYIQLTDIEIDNPTDQIAINSSDALFILKNSELNKYLVKLTKELDIKLREDNVVLSKIVGLIYVLFYYKDLDKRKVEEIIDKKFERSRQRDIGRIVWKKVDKDELIDTVLNTDFVKYDTTIWYRRNRIY